MRSREWVTVGSAFSFVLVLLAVLVVPHETLPERTNAGVDSLPSSEEVHAFFASNYGMQQAQTLLHMVAAGLFLVFAAGLTGATRLGEKENGLWSRVAFGAAIASTAVIVVAMGFVSALLEHHQNLDGRTLVFFYDLGWSLHFKINYLTAIFLVATGLAILRSASLPRWTAWSGIGLGVLTGAATLGNLAQSTYFLQFPSFFLLMVWVLLIGIVLLARDSESPAVVEGAPSVPPASRVRTAGRAAGTIPTRGAEVRRTRTR